MENEKRIDKICSMLDDLVAASKRSTKPEPVEKQVKTPDFYLGYKTGFEAAQPKWISVEERLPEESDKYLTYSRYGIQVMVFHSGCKTWGSVLIGDFDIPVTHWMPLPPAPNDNKEEQS